MKIKRYKATDEKVVLTGMIISDAVLGTISRHLGDERRPFRSKWSNLIAGWCLDHYAEYKEAPKRHIQHRLVRFADESEDDAPVDIIEKFLVILNEDLEKKSEDLNDQYIVDTASRLFNEIRIERLVEEMNAALEDKDTKGALEALDEFRRFEFTSEEDANFLDPELAREIMTAEKAEELIEWPQGLGEFLEDQFVRDSFISFAGPEKRGKSYWLQETVWQALSQRRNVFYVVTGDMGRSGVLKRLWRRATRLPRYEGRIRFPKQLFRKDDEDDKSEIRVRFGIKDCEGMTNAKVQTTIKKLQEKFGKDRIRTTITPASSISAADIENKIIDFIKEGWIPDVVVIDYADILQPDPHARTFDYRQQINETWKTLRKISQKYHLCLVTASQTAATSYDAQTIRKRDFSEDKRKIGHVTGMLGINQTEKEKEDGIYRLNWIVLREGHWTESQVVHTAGNLAIGCPCMVSRVFGKNPIIEPHESKQERSY